MTDQTNLDRLIDDVARDITAPEPPAHLRTRILARLDERRSPRRAWLLIRGGSARRRALDHDAPGSRRTACASESAVTDCCQRDSAR
jgi:hypothetical protein